MFANLNQIPRDELFSLRDEFNQDKNPAKANLGIGVYTNSDGSPLVLPVIKKAIKEIDLNNFYYDRMSGNQDFLEKTRDLIFGKIDYSLAMQQTCGGTHGLSMMARLFERMNMKNILIAEPKWINYENIFYNFNIINFPHLKDQGKIDLESYHSALKSALENSVLLIQGGLAHNPSGFNIEPEEIIKFKDVIEEKKIFIVVDFAYLGLSESFEKDREYIRKLFDSFENIACVFSFSKNASLYKQRLGALYVRSQEVDLIESNLQSIIRQTISNPPAFGANIMNIIYDKYLDEWLTEVEAGRQDIDSRRQRLVRELGAEFEFLGQGHGIFGLLGLNKSQVVRLKKEYAIYMPESSRINFSGLIIDQIPYLAKCIKDVS